MIVERTSHLPAPADAVWRWHERPGALERLTPPWEAVRILGRTGGLEDGARVTLEVRAGPIPLRWVAVHRDVVPGRCFVDEQLEGPFARWTHLHEFLPHGPAACSVRDRIECSLPSRAALAGRIVQRRLERWLAYRHATLRGDLAAHESLAARHFIVSGATGMIGSALVPFLTTGGHRVTRLTRRPTQAGDIAWDPARKQLDARALEGADGIIHLAGANIGASRWTPARRQELVASRLHGTQLLARAIARLEQKPAVLVSVSAVGIYGDRGDTLLGDGTPPGTGFLAELASRWETAADAAAEAGVRTVHPRFGLVLSPAGGALQKFLPPFQLGVGGPLGRGDQWMAPASIDDVLDMLLAAAARLPLAGSFNAVGPEPVTNAEFARRLGEVLGRPSFMTVPAPALRLLLGEMADGILLASQRAVPSRLLAAGHQFRHPAVEDQLRHVLGHVA